MCTWIRPTTIATPAGITTDPKGAMPTPIYTTDTCTKAQAVQMRQLRKLSPQERIRKGSAMSRLAKLQAFAAIRRRHPSLSPAEVQLKYLEIAYGASLADNVRRWQQERQA